MRAGFIGLGKLGLPMALVADAAGHDVFGYDPQLIPKDLLGPDPDGHLPFLEPEADKLRTETSMQILPTPTDLVTNSDLIFVAVQTPHSYGFDGTKTLTEERRDFDYTYLAQACRQLKPLRGGMPPVVIVSTVLPGTTERIVKPSLPPRTDVIYSPSFVAMGSVVQDMREPEFVLAGIDGNSLALDHPLFAFHDAISGVQTMCVTSIASAELAKVAYNTFIGLKIAFANSLMEICEHTAADVDDVSDVLSHATERLLSPMYLRGGMGDGGACHPRDNLALSWLAQRLGLSYDIFENAMMAREAQTEHLADIVQHYSDLTGLDAFLLGTTYKAGVPLQDGSPALLLRSILDLRIPGRVRSWDPTDNAQPPVEGDDPHVFVMCVPGLPIPDAPGSVVIDPWGSTPDMAGMTVVRLGRKG